MAHGRTSGWKLPTTTPAAGGCPRPHQRTVAAHGPRPLPIGSCTHPQAAKVIFPDVIAREIIEEEHFGKRLKKC